MRSSCSFAFFAAILLVAGCSKKEETEVTGDSPAASSDKAAAAPAARPAAAPAASTQPALESMPGENAVRTALAARDYNGAVTKLLGMKNGLPNEMWETYAQFYTEIRNALVEAAQTDPQAAQALAMLRAATAGR